MPRKPAKATDPLTHKQELFVREYLVDMNASRAAIAAGYSEKGAMQMGYSLLHHPKVKARIDAVIQSRAAKIDLSADKILEELSKLGFSNMFDYIEIQDDGTAYVNLANLERDQAAAIVEVHTDVVVMLEDSDEATRDSGKVKVPVKKMRIKLADKIKALELLGKHLALFTDRFQADVTITHEQALEALK